MTPVSFSEIVGALQARTLQVAQVYAPGGHVERGRYWALNPGRADRSIGSFHVGLAGTHAGRWHDHATGEGGDMLDLIQLARGLDRAGAVAEARRFLGLDDETEAQRALRRRHDARMAEERARRAEAAEREAARRRAAAHALWLRCDPRIGDTPVAEYLRARAIGPERFGRALSAIRYHPDLPYRHVDEATGEILEVSYPAMVTIIHGPHVEGRATDVWGVHRTWLARRPDGTWGKAPVPKPKKVMGSMKGGYIRLWSGAGPRGGKGRAMAQAGPGMVYVTEGIEDGLSVAVLKPDVRVAVAISLGNLRDMVLPRAMDQVVIVRDNDAAEENRKQVWRARERWLAEGRAVSLWPADEAAFYGAKDINELLVSASAQEGAA